MSSSTPAPGDTPPPNNPFAALRALRAHLPEGPVPEEGAQPSEKPAAESSERLVVRRERKGHGGKTATRIQGFELAADARATLAKDVKRALGCGARWEGDDLLLQGDLLERAAKWFESRGQRVVRGN